MDKNRKSKRNNEPLWEMVKEYVNKNYRDYGKWNAYKSSISVKLYKELGGGYTGRRSKTNSLRKWLDEKWRYVSPKKKSGRFLPSKVITQMSPRLKRYENSKKRSGSLKGRRNVKYSRSLNKLMKKNKIY